MKNKFIILFAFFCAMSNLYAQNNSSYPGMTEKEGLLYFLGINNNIDPDEVIYDHSKINKKYTENPNTWTTSYLKKFDSYNYKLSKNDEFKCYELYKSAREKIINERQKVDFNRKFNISFSANLGEYNFDLQAFPIYFNFREQSNKFFYRDPEIYLCNINNIADFEMYNIYIYSLPYSGELVLRMSPSEASKLITSRKNINTGKIDRSVSLKITYSILNQKNYKCDKYSMVDYYTGLIAKAYSIDVWSDEYELKKLGEIKKTTTTQTNPNSNTPSSPNKSQSPNNSNEYSNAKAVITSKEDVLYVGINNEINIETSNISIDNIDVKWNSDSYAKFNGKSFIISPAAQGNTIVQFFVKNTNTLICSKQFKVTLVPNPIGKIENFKNNIPIESLQKCKKLTIEVENIKYQINFDVISFDFDIIDVSNGNKVTEINNIGSGFNNETLNKIRLLKKGDYIYIENLKIKGPDNLIRKLEHLIYKII